MKRRDSAVLLFVWFALSIALAACQSPWVASADRAAWPEAEVGLADDSGGAEQTRRAGFAAGGEFADTDDDGLPDARRATSAERMMVYHGAISLEVARADEAIAAFVAQVGGWGGYLSAQQDRTVTVRVPSPRFDEAMAVLRSAGRVLSESRRADDVTRRYVDLEIRLDNARRGRDRLLALLEKATEVEDILAIEKELRRLTEEIETMEGEIKFLADQVAMATIQAEFRSVAEPGPSPRRRRPSRFDWINRIGVDALREDF